MRVHQNPSPRLHTPLCDRLNIRYPIIQAGMAGGITTPELVAAVSNAGGLGVLGAGRLNLEQMNEAIAAIQERTDQPFGVNFLLAGAEPGNRDVAAAQRFLDQFRQELGLPPGESTLPSSAPDLPAMVDAALQSGVRVLSFGLGDPTPFVDAAKASGAVVMAMVSTVEEAVRVVDGGADVVVAQGAEAGGHRTTFEVAPGGEVPLVGTLALVPQVVDALPGSVPVVAAGAIMDGRGLAAALALGAQGVQLGTRFLVARESGAPAAYQERLLRASETDTTITRALSGRPARSLRNRFIDTWERADAPPLAYPDQNVAAFDIFRAAMQGGHADYMPLFAGQGVRLLKPGQRAAEIVDEIVTGALTVLERLNGLTR